MLFTRRNWLALVGAGLLAKVSSAQEEAVMLAETMGVGSTFQYEISLAIDGKMKVSREGQGQSIPLLAKASHRFVERVENPDAKGAVGRAVRHYQTATSDSTTGPDRQVRELPAERRLIIVQRSTQGSVHFCPDGALTREDLDLVAEHFDTLGLTGLLPGKAVKIGDTWAIDAETVQYACLFEGLLKGELTGKLLGVKDGLASFSISGTAEGLESGATAKLGINAMGQFNITEKRIVELVWEQTDDRQQGPVSPASEFKAIVRLKRTALADDAKEITAEMRTKVPAENKVTAQQLALRYADQQNRYQFLFSRDWHITGRTPEHLVLRLLDSGELAAQATITAWKRAEPGQHISVDEFKKVITSLPNWQLEQVLADGVVSNDAGRWLYRLAAQGKQDGIAVVQLFYFLAGPNGHQVAVTVLTHPEKANKLQGRDAALVQAIEFPAKK